MENRTINIEKIMQDIRQEIKDKGLTSDMLSFEDVPYQKPGDAVSGCTMDSEEIRNAMVYLNGHYNIQPYKPLGGNALFVFVKKVIRKLTKFYVEPIVFDQNDFNANVVRVLNAVQQSEAAGAQDNSAELLHRLDVLELNQKQLTMQIEALQKENASLREKLGKQA